MPSRPPRPTRLSNGIRSERGTQVAALLYRLVETARHHGIPEHLYLPKAAEQALRNPGESLVPHQLARPVGVGRVYSF